MANEIFRKSSAEYEWKKDKPGTFIAKFATLNVIDKDGDVILPGAIENGKAILISAYQHGSWNGGLPVGKGVIKEEKNTLLVEGELNLNTVSGKEHYEMMKFSADLQEFSFGFRVLEIDEESEWAKNPKVWRVMKKIDVFEVSPVLKGAGIDTRLVAIKNEKDGLTMKEQTEAALTAVNDLLIRAKSLADLRRKEGRDISNTSRKDMAELREAAVTIQKEIDVLLVQSEPTATDKSGKAELYKAMRLLNEIYGGKN
jgi:HK97 family phage prohead protease